jgi:LysR family transcriptional regulator of gallate degradation
MLHVIDAGGLSAAANAVGRSQQTLSHAIRKLEEELGVQLFERTPQGTFPTPQALIMGERVRNALGHLAEARVLFHEQSPHSVKAHGLRLCELNVSNQDVLIFLAMCEQHDVRCVAKQLGVSTSAVREVVTSLETGAAEPLFEKTRYGLLRPTESGQLLARQLRRALWEIRAGMAEMRGAGQVEGEIIIGVAPRAVAMLLPRIITRVRAKYPALKITHRIERYEALEQALRCRDIDFVVGSVRSPAVADDIAVYPMLRDRLGILARAGHPLCRASYPQVGQYLECQWILPGPHIWIRSRFDECLRRHRLPEPAVLIESGSYELVRSMLLRTDAIALALRCEAMHDVERGTLCFLPAPPALAELLSSTVTLHLLCPMVVRRSPGAQAFFEIATQVAAELQSELDSFNTRVESDGWPSARRWLIG